MEKTISLTDIFKTLIKRWKLIFLVISFATMIGGIVSYYVLKPVYQASTQILVNQKNSEGQLDANLLRSNVDLINTYSVIIKSPAILEKVINQLNLSQSVDQLNKNIAVNSQENSQVFSLTVQNQDAAMAVEIANAISETFQKEIQGIMNVDNVSILAKAEMKDHPVPVKPNPLLNITIAVVVGILGGIGLALLMEFLDNTLKDEKDVMDLLGVPVIGSIPKITHNKKLRDSEAKKKQMGGETVAS